MYILKNAWKNIMRNKGRNILMGVIILLLIAASAVALIINNTAGGIIDNYKQRFDSEVSLIPNMEKIQPVQSSSGGAFLSRMLIPEISPELYIEFGDSDYVSKAAYSSSVGIHKNDALKFIGEEKGGGGMFMIGMKINDDGNTEEDPGLYYAKLLGYNYVPEDFDSGMRQLAEGNFADLKDNECVVSREFFEINGFQIGDTITLTSTLSDRNGEVVMPGEEDTREKISISYTLKIVGYYNDLTDEYAGDFMQTAYDNRRNEIYTTINTVIEPLVDGFSGITVSAKYYLKNPGDLKAFANELYAKGLDDKFDVVTDEDSYNTIVKPIEGLKSITWIFLAIVLILGSIILMLLSSIAIRERKYEIGVLRAMGMKKHKVTLGLLSEVVTITVICLVIGLGSGIVLAQPVSDMLLDNQLKQIEDQGGNSGIMAYGPGGNVIRGAQTVGGAVRVGGIVGGNRTPAEALKEMDVNLGIPTIIEIILVSLLLAVMASMMGILHITKYEPIKILSDRN